MKNDLFASICIEWYERNKRDLPWRKTKNPYFILLSEIILQQTRVQQGLPYYHNFVEKYPTINDLANAPEQEVLRLWQGLGYYSRARNLQKAAIQIVTDFHGKFPDNYEDLLKLKGVGPYTAAAIASFAFDQKVAVVDGNVYRVLARVFGISTDISSGAGMKEFAQLAKKLLPSNNSSTYNQAIMEFGALQCTPALPKCGDCPLNGMCYAFNHHLQHQLPVKINKIKKRIRYFHYIAFRYGKVYLMKERTSKDIWQGLYEFQLYELPQLFEFDELMETLPLPKKMVVTKRSVQFKHMLTHQTIFARFWLINLTDSEEVKNLVATCQLNEYTTDQVRLLPKSVLIIKFLEQYVFD